MKAGKLRHKVTIERPIWSSNATGEATVPRWEIVATVAAQVTPRSAYRREVASQEVATATHDVRTRYVAGVDATCRLLFDGRAFRQTGPPINVEELNAELRFTCLEDPS
jgi:SPP1 family predicted phage head-tail adaptor